MCTARYRSALLCICTSLAAAAGAAAEPTPATVAELELSLARQPQLYLVIDLGAPSLEVKARGMVLDRTRLDGVAVVALQPVLGRRSWPELAPPLLWRISEAPAGDWRRLVAPTALRQYSDRPTDPTEPTPTPAPPAPELPSRYTIGLDSGWQLEISDRPADGLARRLSAAIGDSWRRWTGRPRPEAPPRLMLTMAADDSRRLLHLFQHGLPILVVAARSEARDTGGTP